MSKLLKYLAFFAMVAGVMSCEEKKEPEKEYVFVNLELQSIEHELRLMQVYTKYADTGILYLIDSKTEFGRNLWANYILGNIRDVEKCRVGLQRSVDSLISKINNPNVKIYMP